MSKDDCFIADQRIFGMVGGLAGAGPSSFSVIGFQFTSETQCRAVGMRRLAAARAKGWTHGC